MSRIVKTKSAKAHPKTHIFHIIPNAHLDPVWLWDWREGLNEGIITTRTVLDNGRSRRSSDCNLAPAREERTLAGHECLGTGGEVKPWEFHVLEVDFKTLKTQSF